MTEEQQADRLLELEAGIIEQNYGSYHHVQGRHYRNLDDAARERRRLAEMYLREEIRLEGICAWCDRPFDEDEQKTPAAGRFHSHWKVYRRVQRALHERWWQDP